MPDGITQSRRAPQELLDRLKERFGNRYTASPSILDRHGKGESYHPAEPPDAVVFAHTTEEVSEAVKMCAAYNTPIIPFGTGTSLEGHIAAREGGVSIDVSEMNSILEVNAEDLDCRVEAGVTRKQLNEYLRDQGLFFPIDPGANASLGGMSATGASGTNAVRYGTMRQNVLGLTVVQPDGSIIKTGGRARKSSAGYDLTHLYVGSEGTLGVITEVQLRLYGQPEAISAAVCSFPSMEEAANTAIMVIQCGIPVARMELLDGFTIRGLNNYAKLNYAEQPTIFFEFHGTEAGVQEQTALTGEIAREHGGSDFQWCTHPEDRSKLWQARHDALYATLSLKPGSAGWGTDVCVPISRLAECITESLDDLKNENLMAPLVGHVGDGNFHLLYLLDPGDEAQEQRAKAHSSRMVERAIAMGGTCTGEHGVGYGKMGYLEKEHGAGTVETMRLLKRSLDPHNLMNPGKVVSWS